MTARVSIDDLLFAADWLDTYEADNDDISQANGEAAERVIKWLHAEVARRRSDANIRAIQARVKADTGRAVSAAYVRAALAKVADR